ncbi:MAG TPA: alkaline phosphatase family protein [bacterium]|nr:alkaline phosphatase family protein [bacterium]
MGKYRVVRSRFSRPLLGALLVVLLLVVVGVGAQWLARVSFSSIVSYPAPVAVTLEPGAPGPALSRRVVMVVIDGLRMDAFQRMGLLERYRRRASLWRVWVDEPSLSFPGWTAILSGAPPEISGVTTNWYRGAVKVDHLMAAARRSGLSTAAAGSAGWGQLFAGSIEDFVGVSEPGYTDLPGIHATTFAVTTAAERILREGRARLVLLHYPAPDLMGHGFGATSQAYADAVRAIDEDLTRLLGHLDLESTTVVITSDHGHIDSGGHGGWERVVKEVPLLFLGAGIAPDEWPEPRRHADIAPTVAALLGVRIPAHSVGRPLIEALAEIPGGLEQRWSVQQARLFDAYSVAVLGRHEPVLTSPLGGPDPEAIIRVSDELSRQMARWRAEALARDRARRLPFIILAAVLPLAYLFVGRPRRDLVPALAGAAVFSGVNFGLYFGKGYYYSLSLINREELLQPFLLARTIDAAIAVAIGALVAGWAARRRGVRAAALTGVSTSFFAAYLMVAQVLPFVLNWGIRFRYYLPDLRAGFKFYLDLLALTPVGLLGLPLVAVSLLGYALGRGTDRLTGGRRRPAATPDSPSSAAAPGRPE